MLLLHGYVILRRGKSSTGCRAGLHMTAGTLGYSQMQAIQHVDGKYQHAMTSCCMSLLKYVRLLNG